MIANLELPLKVCSRVRRQQPLPRSIQRGCRQEADHHVLVDAHRRRGKVQPGGSEAAGIHARVPGRHPNTKCAYPADPLQKLASAKLEEKNPKVFAMFEKVQITNEQQLALLPAVEIDEQPAADVAAEWIAGNEAIWSTWIQ